MVRGRRIGIAFCAATLSVAAIASLALGDDSGGPELIVLSTPRGVLRASIAPDHGGELAGLETLRNGRWQELLYRGRDYRPTKGWTGKAPILWPATGRNFPNSPGSPDQSALGWVFDGKLYPLAIHGFARDQSWQVVERGVCGGIPFLKLALHDNPQTRRVYPFGFELTSEYILAPDTIYLRQTVCADAANIAPMPFSIGNHITFRVPLLPGAAAETTTLSTPATMQVMTDTSGRPTGSVIEADYASPRPLSSFRPLTAVSLSGYPAGQEAVRLADPSGLVVTVSHTEDRRPAGTPVLFNLWGDPEQGYFAPEPWLGKQNSLMSGDGATSLSPGKTFHWTVAIQVGREGAVEAVSSPPAACAPDRIDGVGPPNALSRKRG